MRPSYQVGDRVVYTREKYTSRPSAGLKNLSAERRGESYRYQVEKYWIVSGVLSGGRIEVCTRRGYRHVVWLDDMRLRHATVLERIFKGNCFPTASSWKARGSEAQRVAESYDETSRQANVGTVPKHSWR